MQPQTGPCKDFPVQLLQSGTVRTYEAGQFISKPDRPDEVVRVVLSGQAHLLVLDSENQEIVVDTLGSGDIFGFTNGLGEDLSLVHAFLRAQEPCEVLEVPVTSFRSILNTHPDVGRALNNALLQKLTALHQALLTSRLQRRALRSLISRKEHVFPDYMIGDYVQRRLSSRIEDLAQSAGPVLVVGESGVGKEHVAHRIFGMSSAHRELFLLLDLFRQPQEFFADAEPAEQPSDTPRHVENQKRLLFGSVEMDERNGLRESPGYIDLSEQGTLMIRGVERLDPTIQSQLLTCALTGSFRRLGETSDRKADFRLIATTRLDPSEVSVDTHPLIHGLANRSIDIPPLRHRRKEIPALVDHYAARYRSELNKENLKLPRETLSMLVNYAWPGNDMELATTLKRAILVSDGEVLRPRDIYFDLRKVEGRGKLNLLRFEPFRNTFLSPLFPAVLQSMVAPFFLILLALLFLGPSDPLKNPAALFCWSVGWPTLFVGAFLLARFWCTLCPIGTLSRLAQKLLSLNLPFPAILRRRSDFVIAGSVLCVIWFETATDIRNSPVNLALLLVAMLGSAIMVAVLFERQSWCQYLCGLGGMVGVAAKASMIELRADQNVCISRCTSNECYVGTEAHEGCPFGQSVPRLDSNRLCKICGRCIKNCPHDAVSLSLRIPGKEIWEMRRANTGTAFLVIGMMSGLLSELLTKTPLYAKIVTLLPLPDVGRFTVVFVTMLLASNLVVLAAAWASHRVYGDSWEENYCRYGLGLIPLALTAFVAYHVYYLVNLGALLPPLLGQFLDSEPLRNLNIKVPPHATHLVQQALVWIGLVWTLFIIYRLALARHAPLAPAAFAAFVHALVAIGTALLILQGIRYSFYGLG
jgi:transcriptional regulator with AAA-type ATPase domain/polyferredoxin